MTALRILVCLISLAVLLAAVALQGEAVPPASAPSVYDEELARIDREALGAAYRAQVIHLYEVWMRDPTGQPERAVAGERRARKAFIDAMTAIDARFPR
jgi:hypothetical protein